MAVRWDPAVMAPGFSWVLSLMLWGLLASPFCLHRGSCPFLMSVTLSNHLLLSKPQCPYLKSQGGLGPLGCPLPRVTPGRPHARVRPGSASPSVPGFPRIIPFCSMTFCDVFSTEKNKTNKQPTPFPASEYCWVTSNLLDTHLCRSQGRLLLGCLLLEAGNNQGLVIRNNYAAFYSPHQVTLVMVSFGVVNSDCSWVRKQAQISIIILKSLRTWKRILPPSLNCWYVIGNRFLKQWSS